MSLIRSGSNPEKIYALHTISGNTEIHQGPYKSIIVPREVFEDAVFAWLRGFGDEAVEVSGFRISEHVLVPEVGLQITLSYKDTEIRMWPVTWHYIIQDYELEFENILR